MNRSQEKKKENTHNHLLQRMTFYKDSKCLQTTILLCTTNVKIVKIYLKVEKSVVKGGENAE